MALIDLLRAGGDDDVALRLLRNVDDRQVFALGSSVGRDGRVEEQQTDDEDGHPASATLSDHESASPLATFVLPPCGYTRRRIQYTGSPAATVEMPATHAGI